MAELLRDLHFMVGRTETVEIEAVKSRLITHDVYFVGEDTSRRAFMHLTCSVMPGRPETLLHDLGTRMHKKMVETVRSLVPSTINASITLEIRDINASLFFRTPAPSTI